MRSKLIAVMLPEWARPDHPILIYELAHQRQNRSLKARTLQAFVVAAALGGAGYLYASNIAVSSATANWTEFLWRGLYFPTLLLQALTALIALALGIGAVDRERHRNTWDHLRLTDFGAGLILRARWITIVYRLRAPILAILLAKVFLLFGLLYDLTALSGRYFQNISAATAPYSSDWRIALVFLAALAAVNLLLPLSIVSASAALGLLISVAIRERIYALMLQVTLSVLQIMLILGSLLAVTQILQGTTHVHHGLRYALVLVYSGLADAGMLFTQLGSLGEIWKLVPYGFTIGIGLLALLLLQVLAADGLLWLAAQLAESRE